MAIALWRVTIAGVPRWARGPVLEGPRELLPNYVTLDRMLAQSASAFSAALATSDTTPLSPGVRLLAPVDGQEIWAAGVTYERSRAARREESIVPGLYEQVYESARPELFFKSTGARACGSGEAIGIRIDSTWDVPEPELALVVTSSGDIVGFTIGNDVSSRSIEGENALFLPQAKCYTGSCAIGPCIVPIGAAPAPREMVIDMRIARSGQAVFRDQVSVARMKREPKELVAWLFAAQEFPNGVLLLTGTGLVPPNDFSLREGDEVLIEITGLGQLQNEVRRVGRRGPSY